MQEQEHVLYSDTDSNLIYTIEQNNTLLILGVHARLPRPRIYADVLQSRASAVVADVDVVPVQGG